MEFPHLGEHCQEPSCNRLDFLPFRCTSCKKIFCKDHFNENKHSCSQSNGARRDFQVPLCPLCNQPVPYKRSEMPDIAMSTHIDRDCKSDPAEERRRNIFSNKCSKKGCKQKELIPFQCQKCRRNYCIRHRLEIDHDCSEMSANQRNVPPTASAIPRPATRNSRPPSGQASASASNPIRNPASMSESEALEYALRLSLAESNQATTQPKREETEDEMLARVLAESEREYAEKQNAEKKDNCSLQ